MSKVCKYSSTIDNVAREALQSKADLVDGTIPSSQLPSYVDDVLEYTSKSSFPETGESGKVYVDTSSNITYRWSGTTYVAIGSDLALGETASTAYAGDKGKELADKLGSTDISSIASTITEAINTLKSGLGGKVDKERIISNLVDIDNITETGFYRTYSAALNAKLIIHLCWDNNYHIQIVHEYSDLNSLKFRVKELNEWHEWIELTETKKDIHTINGNGSTKVFSFTNNLSTQNVLVQVYDSAGATVYVDTTRTADKITVSFATAPAQNEKYTVVVV